MCLAHGVQNALLDALRSVFSLPAWGRDGILMHRKAAAKIIQSVADVSIAKAKEQEQQYIVHHPDSQVPVTISEDGAYGNKSNNSTHYCYIFNVNQTTNEVTDHEITEQRPGGKIRVTISYTVITRCYRPFR